MSPFWWPRGQGQELGDEDMPHELCPALLNFASVWSHRDPGLHGAAATHSLCPFSSKKKTPCCWCEFTAGGATGDAQLVLSVVPFPFEKRDTSSCRVTRLLGCWELLDVILGWCGAARGPLLSVPATLAWEQEKVTLSGLRETWWLLGCVRACCDFTKALEDRNTSLASFVSLMGGLSWARAQVIRCDHVSVPSAFVHCCSWGRCWGSGRYPADKVSKGWREKSVTNFFPLPNVSCQSFPAG